MGRLKCLLRLPRITRPVTALQVKQTPYSRALTYCADQVLIDIQKMLLYMVPRAGLEPAHPKARDFKSLVSTNFTIGASTQCSDLLHVLSGLSIIRPRLHIFLTQVLWLLVSYTEINFVKNDWLACREGFEPPTLCLEGTCSIHLSYRQTECFVCQLFCWCPEPDSNRHTRRREILSLLCLPISPSGQL